MADSANVKTSNFTLLFSKRSSMSERIADCTPQPSATPSQTNRNLAWQIAPNLFVSFKYAWAGVRYAFITQRNFRIHTFVGILAIGMGVFLKISATQMAVVGLTCAMVMVLELLNTAIESVVDLTVKQSYHELAKIAKDCAAGAVLLSAIAALLVASCILLPPLFELIFSIAIEIK
jgi:diacylglycerol kinase (ATP)